MGTNLRGFNLYFIAIRAHGYHSVPDGFASSALLFFIGTGLFAFYTVQPDLLAEPLQGQSQGDQVFPFFIVTTLPEGFRGLLIAGIFAAGMSSIDSSLNCSATLILTDFCKRNSGIELSEKQSMRILRLGILVCGVLAIWLGLSMIGIKSALDVWWKLSSTIGGGILGLFLLGFFSRKVKNVEAVVGVCAGVLVIFWMTLTPTLAEVIDFLKIFGARSMDF